MKPTTEILARISQNAKSNNNEIFTRLYRYMLRPDLYFMAYQKLYANKGASTKGVNNDTADGFSERKIAQIIKSLADESYTPKPARRMYIKKKNGKMRPLGIPTFTDKLVQEVLRMVLESVYEPIFLNCSHGFRPNKSCHTALKDVKHQFHGTRWFVEGDIKGCFDNINHSVLVGLINAKIKDARLIKLIYKFLKAGYMENWQYQNTYSGTPQGGIISPLLSNICLHELDKFVMGLKVEFDKPRERWHTPEYNKARYQVESIREQLKNAAETEKQELVTKLKNARAVLLKTPCKSQTDKQIKYIRYADDFLIGVNGSKEDCQWIKSKLMEFIQGTLKMELSEEKTLITHSNNYARFLGYDVRVRRDEKIKHGSASNCTKRTLNNMTELVIPFHDKIHQFIFTKSIAEQKNDELWAVKRTYLVHLTPLEIVSTYNAELRGICNYYRMASNFNKLNYLDYLMGHSCLKTLAAKHKCSVAEVMKIYKDGKGGWGIPYETKKGVKRLYFAKYADSKNVKNPSDNVERASVMYGKSTTTFEDRLKASVCALCGDTQAKHYEIHHVNKVKNLTGKEPWERIMIAKRRKTIVLCEKCHTEIHK